MWFKTSFLIDASDSIFCNLKRRSGLNMLSSKNSWRIATMYNGAKPSRGYCKIYSETNKFFRKLFALTFLPQEHIVEAFQVNISIIEIRILCINVLTWIAVFQNDTYFQSAAIVKWGQIHSDCIKISDIITTWRGITCRIAITIEGVENAYLTRNVHFQYRP